MYVGLVEMLGWLLWRVRRHLYFHIGLLLAASELSEFDTCPVTPAYHAWYAIKRDDTLQ